jgi:hypothetical protein
MPDFSKLTLVSVVLCALGSVPSAAADIAISGGYAVEHELDDDVVVEPRVQRRVTVHDEQVAAPYPRPPLQRRLVERHIIERYVEEPLERQIVRRRAVEPVLLPPMPIGPERIETRVRVRPVVPAEVLGPVEERRYVRPHLEERQFVGASPAPLPECRLVTNRRIDRLGYEEVTRTRICD